MGERIIGIINGDGGAINYIEEGRTNTDEFLNYKRLKASGLTLESERYLLGQLQDIGGMTKHEYDYIYQRLENINKQLTPGTIENYRHRNPQDSYRYPDEHYQIAKCVCAMKQVLEDDAKEGE